MAASVQIDSKKRLCFLLGWDATKDSLRKPNFFQRIKLSLESTALFGDVTARAFDAGGDNCDLDLVCYAFGADKKLVDFIIPGNGRDINESGSIYHSGDQETGTVANFDEELFIDLAKMTDDIAIILVGIRVDSDYDVGAKDNVRLRILNTTEGKIILDGHLGFPEPDSRTCIVGRLERKGDGWMYTRLNAYINQYPDEEEEEVLAPFLGGAH